MRLEGLLINHQINLLYVTSSTACKKLQQLGEQWSVVLQRSPQHRNFGRRSILGGGCKLHQGRSRDDYGILGLIWLSEITGCPGSFVDCSPRLILAWIREALLGLKSKSCCMSFGSPLKAACRSPFSFWHAAVESACPPPECCNRKGINSWLKKKGWI